MTGFTLFWDGPLSQWHPSPMTVAGQRYGCAEHWMMHAKARLFGDGETAAAILAEPEPVRQKSLGRRVRGFDERVWEGARHAIVFTGSVAKFTQNPDLRAALFATGSTRIVEASPIDRVWGIGLAAADPRAQDPAQWRGLNLLGDILTEVRDALRAVAG